MGEKGNQPSEALSLADRTVDAAGQVGDAALGAAAGTATGVATARLEKRMDAGSDDATTDADAATQEPPEKS